MITAPVLIELLTEELPPKALPRLSQAFADKIVEGLQHYGLIKENVEKRWFATPRRLAVLIDDVPSAAAAKEVSEKLMPVSVAFDPEGNPSLALLKKIESKGISKTEIPQFERRLDGKVEALFHTAMVPGAQLNKILPAVVHDAIKALPIPKVMHWGAGEATFVRPVHYFMMLHGSQIVSGTVLDLQSNRITMGHRFMSRGEIEISSAEAYEPTLLAEGKVIPHFYDRRTEIERQLQEEAHRQQAQLGAYSDLLDEVTALVEHPTVYVGQFESEFLAVPQECLILTMQANQKYFPLFDGSGKLLNRFLIVSNMQLTDPKNIISGNQRVIRPRLADARFFFEQDKKQPLATRLERLASVVYHNKLGNQLERVQRLEKLAEHIAKELGGDTKATRKAAQLAKADLLTDMVGEFPELQGVMGRYYALADGESMVIANAIETHYLPRFAGDVLPEGTVACAVALADKLDALTGFFGIGMTPTGDKDPFALRRAALGILRILIETPLPLSLDKLISYAANNFKPDILSAEGFQKNLMAFLTERLRNLLREKGYEVAVIDAVLAHPLSRIDLVSAKLDAVEVFRALPEADALAAANKRIINILKKTDNVPPQITAALLQEPAEQALFKRLTTLAPQAETFFSKGNYTEALCILAGLHDEIDVFFDQVMVMSEDISVRQNRLALLGMLAKTFNQIADISRLSA